MSQNLPGGNEENNKNTRNMAFQPRFIIPEYKPKASSL
jgi:hypothetical protein